MDQGSNKIIVKRGRNINGNLYGFIFALYVMWIGMEIGDTCISRRGQDSHPNRSWRRRDKRCKRRKRARGKRMFDDKTMILFFISYG
jgi:hypothetical protein